MAGVSRKNRGEVLSAGKVTASSGGLWDAAGRVYSPANPPVPVPCWVGSGANPYATTPPMDRWYPAGTYGTSNDPGALVMTTSKIWYMPIIAAAAAVAGLMCNVTTLAASTNVRMALYRNLSAAALYPDALLTDSGAISSATTGAKVYTPGTPIDVVPGELLWLAVGATGTPTLSGVDTPMMWPILGYGLTSATVFNATPCVGWTETNATPLASGFPSTATTGMAMVPIANIPMGLVRFQ